MNTKAIVGIGIGIIVLAGIGYYAMTQMKSGIPTKGSAPLATLAQAEGSFVCTVSSTVGEAAVNGTVHVGNGKIRGDYTSSPPSLNGQEVSSHMIQADGVMYVWSDRMPQGFKMHVAATETEGGTMNGPMPADTTVDYTCSPWVADEAVFVPPSTITFAELRSTPTAE